MPAPPPAHPDRVRADFYWTRFGGSSNYGCMWERAELQAPIDPLQISREVSQAYRNRRIAAVKGVRHGTLPAGDRSVDLTLEKRSTETIDD